jgi:hypothetical protein
MEMMTLLAAFMLFCCSENITTIAKFQNFGPEIPQTLEKVYLTLTLHFFSFILVYGSLQLMYKHGNDKTVC